MGLVAFAFCVYTCAMSSSYQVGGGFTDQELQAANWWVQHNVFLSRLGYTVLVLLIAGFWGYVSWSLLDAYVISYPREQRIPAIIASNQRLKANLTADAPGAIQVSPVANFAGTEGRRDLLTEITNPNKDWWAEFEYQFKFGDESTPVRKGYVLPGGQRYLTEVGWKSPSGGGVGSPEFVVSSLAWHRVDPAKVERDYAEFAAKRLQLQTDQPTYNNNAKIGTQTVGQTSFTLQNNSAYGFWSVDLTIVLFRGGAPVAVTQLNQTNLKPGERRPISFNWFDNLTGISNTVVQANVNILDPSVFLPPNRF